MELSISKIVSALPSPLERDTIYFVRVGQGYDQYVTNTAGEVAAYRSNVDIDLDALALRVTSVEGQVGGKANNASPALTGTPTAPTATAGTNTTQLATTAFVTTAVASAGGGSSVRRVQKTFALFGDSLSGNNSDLGRMYTRGFLTFAQQMSGHRVYFDHSFNFGVGGDGSAEIAARVSTVLAKAPDICLVEMGGNDTNRNIAPETTIANIKTVLDALTGAGIRVILCTIYPTAGTTNPVHLTAVARINQYVADCSRTYNLVEVLDAYDIMFNNDTGLVKVGYTTDTTHPGAMGSWMMGKALAKLITQLVPVERHIPLTNPNDKWDLTAAKQGNIFVNPRFTGTGGTTVGSGGSGTLPDGWVLNMSSARGCTVSVAKLGVVNGFDTLEVTLSGTTTSATATYVNNAHIWLGEVLGGTTAWNSTALGGYLRDTAIYKSITLECEVENLVGVTAVGAEIFHLSSGGDKPSNGDGLLTVNTTNPSTGASSLLYPTEATTKLVLHAEPEEHTGKSQGYRIGLHIACLPGVTVGGKIRISRPVFRSYETKQVN